jgi:hypothetical protein
MLRRAMDLGGLRQVIFICHAPLVRDLADVILSVGGGCLVIGSQQAAFIECGQDTAGPPPADYGGSLKTI